MVEPTLHLGGFPPGKPLRPAPSHLQVQDPFYFTDNSSVAPISAGLRPRRAKLHPTPTEKEPSQAAWGRPGGHGHLRKVQWRKEVCAQLPIFAPISAPPTARAPGAAAGAAVPAQTPAHYCSPALLLLPQSVAPLRLRSARSWAAVAMLNPYGEASGGDRVVDSGIGSRE